MRAAERWWSCTAAAVSLIRDRLLVPAMDAEMPNDGSDDSKYKSSEIGRQSRWLARRDENSSAGEMASLALGIHASERGACNNASSRGLDAHALTKDGGVRGTGERHGKSRGRFRSVARTALGTFGQEKRRRCWNRGTGEKAKIRERLEITKRGPVFSGKCLERERASSQ
jgi:hypothetical protein